MMNQRTIRTGRGAGLLGNRSTSDIAFGHNFMSRTFCNCRLPRTLRPVAVQIGGNRGFVEPNSAENEFTKLQFQDWRRSP